MAIRLNLERLIGLAIFVLFLVWAVLVATGCMTDVDVPITPVDLSDTTTTTTTVPVSIEHTDGPVTVITLAGATPWTIAGLVGLLGLLQTRRQRTATGALDRIIRAIEIHDNDSADITVVKSYVRENGLVTGGWEHADRHERFIRSRLARLKK